MRAFRVAYDGRPFAGFQRQPDAETVEGALFDALDALDVYDPEGSPPSAPPGYAAAGRTDAGVSALAQTVALRCPDWLSPAALNAQLPAAVRAWASAVVPDDFHATHDATGREYTYYLHAPTADDDRATAALAALCGRHDFHNLTPDDRGTVRTLDGEVTRDGDFLAVCVRAGGFPRHLVRRLVTLVGDVAAGEASLADVERALGPDPLPGPAGVAAAPPHPLVLTDVAYPDVSFVPDPDAVPAVREAFDARRVEYATRTRVLGRVADGVDAGTPLEDD